MRIGIITTYPPGEGSLNEYGYHFVHHLRTKREVSEIVLLVDDLAPGDTYRAEALANSEYDAPIRFVPCWRFGALNNPVRILRAVRGARPDVVLFNIQFASFGKGKIPATLGLMAPVLIKLFGTPTAVLLHNIMEQVDLKQAGFATNPLIETVIRLFGRIVTRFLLATDWVIVTIPKYVEILEARYHASNVLLAPHGSFDDSAPVTPDPPTGPLQIMTFGKFGTYKKVEVLIEALKILRQGNRPPLQVVIAGTDSPNTAGYLENVRQKYADVPGVIFTGYVAEEQVPQVFNQATVVVFPYNSTTGSSGVLHQAGSYGKAVVLPKLGDLAELITEEGYAGEFFEPENAVSLADAIARLIDHPERIRELGARNYAAARGLPMSEVVDWYLFHFQELLNKHR